VLSLIVFGCTHARVSYFVSQHRKLVLPLLADPRSRVPYIGSLLVYSKQQAVHNLVAIEFAAWLKEAFPDNDNGEETLLNKVN
jgi:hypothetical protein